MQNVYDILLRLTEKVERANTIQHSGGKVRKEDWSELFQLTNEARGVLASQETPKTAPGFYLCGGCDHYHPMSWGGDCRDDSKRFTEEQLEKKYGREGEGWEEVEE